ncbi:MAG: ABC transporter permease [Anaerolineales bacterium]|nr:ABC transporter permease [Anaerolineales bacterium]
MNIQITLAFRYLSGRKLRTVLTTLAVVFGVMVIFGMNILLPAFIQGFQANMMAVAGEVDATITHKTGAPFTESIVERIMKVDGVRAASGNLNRTITLPSDFFDKDPSRADRINALTLVGLDLDSIRTVRAFPVVDGRFLQVGDTDVAVINQTLADNLMLEPGDSLAVPAVSGILDMEIVGILPAKTTPGNEEIFIPLADAQAALNMPMQINAINANLNTIEKADREAILAAIQDEIGSNFEIGALASGGELLANIRIAQSIINLLGVLALFMGGFIIFNTFRTIITERRRDIGMLRAIGANRKTILGLILIESIIQGVIGTMIGLVLGYLLAFGMISFIQNLIDTFLQLHMGAPVVTPGILAASILLGIGSTLLSGIIPAINASRLMPLEALRPAETEVIPRPMSGRSFWTGVIMIGAALFFLLIKNFFLTGFGSMLFFLGLILISPGLVQPISNGFARLVENLFVRQGIGNLAAGNLTRQPTRTAVTATATMIGMAVIIMAFSIVTSLSLGFNSVLEKTLGSDFLVIPPTVMAWGGNVGLNPDVADQLRAIDQIDAVSTLRFATSETSGIPISLLGIDPTQFSRVSALQITEGDQDSVFDELANGRVVIANTALAMNGGIHVGDEISLVTVNGEQAYRIAAIGMDYMNAKIAGVFISQENIAADFGMAEDIMLQINLKKGVQRDSVEPQIRALLEPYPQFNLISGIEYIEQNQGMLKAAFSGMYAMLIFMSIPSLIAMINTLAIGVIERTREIGMLRAVGSTRKQIRLVILVEALILAAIGTFFGIAAGLYLGYLGVSALAMAGYPLEYLFPISGVIAAIIAGLVFGALAAVIPSRQAARMDVVAALRYE